MDDANGNRLAYTVAELIEAVPMSREYLRQLEQRGELKPIRLGRKILYLVVDVNEWLANQGASTDKRVTVRLPDDVYANIEARAVHDRVSVAEVVTRLVVTGFGQPWTYR